MSDSESTGGKYDSDDSFFDPAAEYAWLGEYGKLLRACGFMGSAKAARRLLDAGVPIKGPRGEPTPLACAIQHNMVDIARLLVARGADVIERACRFCQPHAVRFLLANGAAWDRANRYGETPLFYARKSTDKLWMMMNRYFDGCLEKYWTLRLGLRVIGRRSAAQQLVLEDKYLANYLGSFVVGEFVLSNRPTYPPDPVYVIPTGLPQPEVPSWVELVARPR